MKQINLFRNLVFVAMLIAAGSVSGQIHPLSFGIGTINTAPNWYANYIGMRFEVDSPSAIAGSKAYTTANDGSGATTDWGGVVTVPIINMPIFMDSTADSSGCSAFSPAAAASMAGKIAVIWRGPLSTPCDFGCKALYAQEAGAIACVLINEYAGQGPVGMAASTSCTGITIPVFMIGNLDGIAISGQYRAGQKVTMTITPWGQGYANDLGFVPVGAAMWHNYAVPSNQLGTSGNPTAYNMLDGAFIANFGSNPAYGVQLKTTTTFTPTGGTAAPQHTSEVDFAGPFYDDGLTGHTTADSVMAMFSTTEYALSASGTGRFDFNYLIESDSADNFPADNSVTTSFYVTDSLYSKGTYDFTNMAPSRTIYEEFGGGIDFCWGPMYYVAKAGTALSAVQYSLAKSYVAGNPTLPVSGNNVYLFQWTDGLVGGTPDSLVENGELELVGSATKTFDVNDTSEATLYTPIYTDTNGNNTGSQVMLQANSWYYVCIDVPATTTNAVYLGCDGILNPYPRVYGRYHANYNAASGNSLLDYSSMELGFPKDSVAYYAQYGNAPVPAGETRNINSVDSFVFSSMKGLIPAVSMIANNNPTNAVKTVGKPLANVTLYPNPAKDAMNVSISFDKNEPTVSYEIIDGLGRFVSKEVHNNVQSEIYSMNTSKLASGNYYLIINAENRIMTRKFTVAK